MILIRRLLGDVLRRKRQSEGRTLRQLAAEARISPGYLSEIERGQKEPSSELLAAICEALNISLSELLREVSVDLAAAELAARIEAERIAGAARIPVGVGARVGGKSAAAVPPARIGAVPVGGTPVGSTAVGKASVLAKPVARAAAHPAGRPGSRPAAVRPPTPGPVPPVPVAAAAPLPFGGLPVPIAAGFTGVGAFPETERVMKFPMIPVGDLALLR